MSSSDLSVLMNMGFSKIKAERALQAAGNNGVKSAIDWLLIQTDEDERMSESDITLINTDSQVETSIENKSSNNSILVAKSFKCDICNNLFNTNLEIEFHTSKSGHNKFSECNQNKRILNLEEKKCQLQMLEDSMKQKRKDREETEKKEIIQKERNRIRSGKEISEAKKKLEDLEIKRLLELRKKEKQEDIIAREKIKKLIEADRIARRPNTLVNGTNTNLVKQSSASTSSILNKRDYCHTRLQIRLTNGQIIMQNFGCKEQLSAVRLYIELNRTDEDGPFILMTNFPKKIFTDHDYDTPLDVLGLVPSAVIIVQKGSKNNIN